MVGGGERDAFIVASIGELQNADVVPRCAIELTEEDRRKMTNQGVPPECSDDLSIVQARFALDKELKLAGWVVSEPGRDSVTRSDVLKQLENFLMNTSKPGGMHVIRPSS